MDCEMLSIYPAQDLTIAQCRELGAYFHDLYAWKTNNKDHLWCAAMALYLVRMAKLRAIDRDTRTIYEVSEGAGSEHASHIPFKKLAHIEYSIPNMVGQYKRNAQGQRALETMVTTVGLDQ